MKEYEITYEKQLKKHGKLLYREVGASMRPLLYQDRDIAIIEKPMNQLRNKRGEVVLFKVYNTYLLSRIIRALPSVYYFCGDGSGKANLFFLPDCQILGLMTSFIRNGKEYSVNDWRYHLYSLLWSFLVIPIRVSVSGCFRQICLVIYKGNVTQD